MKYSKKIISKFGGVRAMARALGIPVTTIQYWWEKGHIPSQRQSEVMTGGSEHGVELSPNDFFDLPKLKRKTMEAR